LLTIGLMSGTSIDGIDGALIKTDGLHEIFEIEKASLRYETPFHHALKATEYSVRKHKGDLEKATVDIAAYTQDILKLSPSDAEKLKQSIQDYFGKLPTSKDVIEHSTDLHGDVVEALLQKSDKNPREISVIGYHGQNLYHAPHDKITVQVGNPERLFNRFQIPVVFDFRKNDVLSGGQGAPFAPLYHQALCIRDNLTPAAIVNCGGISNVTFVQGPNEGDLMGFDTGPGNGLVDLYIKRQTQGEFTYDHDGQFGLQGHVIPELRAALFENLESFLKKSPPKSLDIADFSLPEMTARLPLYDVVRTLEEFTAETILKSLDYAPAPKNWILAGGGWNNPVILTAFEEKLLSLKRDARILKADQVGWNSDALEAQIFAYLAVRSLKELPLSLPTTTGVPKPVCGGRLVR